MKLPDRELGCHRTGFTRKCRDLVTSEECNRWRASPATGNDPTTGKPVPEYDCVDNLVLLADMISNQQTHQLGAAIESFRNEMVKANEANLHLTRAAIGVAFNQLQLRPDLPQLPKN